MAFLFAEDDGRDWRSTFRLGFVRSQLIIGRTRTFRNIDGIGIGHPVTPAKSSELRAQGTAGAAREFLNALKDALAPPGIKVARPFTPERIQLAPGRV